MKYWWRIFGNVLGVPGAQLRINEHLPLGVLHPFCPEWSVLRKAKTLFPCVLHICFTVPPLSRRPSCSFPGPLQLFSCWETKALPSPSVPCLTGKGSKLGLPPTADSPSCPYACPFEPSHSAESPDDGACFSGRFSH